VCGNDAAAAADDDIFVDDDCVEDGFADNGDDDGAGEKS
jgi:hypothetical protein